MTRFERAFGILLALADGRTVTATALAGRFEVSVRTIYRDVEMLSATGVPVYAERGAAGGYRLLEGYFLPPVAFTREEAVAGLLALALARGLSVPPFPAALEAAERKLVAALPARLRPLLAETRRLIGFERAAADIFHPEPDPPDGADGAAGHAVEIFLKGALDRTRVRLAYRSPYRDGPPAEVDAEPQGLLWDRDLWYLIGRRVDVGGGRPAHRFWRADRVAAIAPTTLRFAAEGGFDVRRHLGRAWLGAAMAAWADRSPVVVRMRADQAARLRRDWMYRFARFAPDGDGVRMTWGEVDPGKALELVRWLGPGAELLSPPAWRALLREEAAAMAAAHG
ncbi:MAG: WYL domain-containing protein [Alphaproteobacteria bacterium]|nr:WYL domain-containing protein [Alphaproteobacteria bacterium]